MLSHRHFRLRTLGRLSLSTVTGEVEHAEDVRPRHLAVLSVLAAAGKPVPRDRLLGLFWGGEPEDRARHSLSNALSGLRALLGAGAISARRDDVALGDELHLDFDVLQFTAACDAHDDARAVALYEGCFLESVFVSEADEFDSWLSRERGRLERMMLAACARLVPSLLRAERWADAAAAAERWLAAAPDSESALAAVALTNRMRGEPAAAELKSSAVAAAERQSSAIALPLPGAVVPARRSRAGILGAGVAAAVLIIIWLVGGRPASAREATRPIVAVAAIDDARGDSSIAWLRAGLPRLITGDLEAAGGLEVVPPSRVRDVLVRLNGTIAAPLRDGQAVDVARRLGATWVVTGGVSAANGGYLLDLTAQNTADASEHESFTVSASDPIALSGLAASRLAILLSDAPGAVGDSARYSGVVTANPDAYRHFVRGMLALEAERYTEAAREGDAAIALDSGFVEAIRVRRGAAVALGDTAAVRRLARLEQRHQDRQPALDRLIDQMQDADSLGETVRAEAFAQRMVERFPRDPRAHSRRADLMIEHGRWADAERYLLRELALDSLAMVAGTGPCTPCEVLWRLARVRLAQGNRTGAEEAARRWVSLQPDLPSAWRNLSATLAAVGRTNEAVDAGFHLVALSREALSAVDFGRTMLSARRYALVDSLVRAWRGTRDPVLANGARDLQLMLERERGQFGASLATFAAHPELREGLAPVEADGLARVGRIGDARKLFEEMGHPAGSSRTGQLTAPEARGYSWMHALEADALLRAGDTLAARPLIDSLEHSGAQSYYGRDRLLHHHVRGMLFFAEGRFADAERELRLAEWSANSWTRTNIELARAQLAQRHTADAIATLRDAYLAPLDGMGRYVPRSEIDFWMARAFNAAGMADSSARYAGYVREAWRDGDRQVRARLDSIGR